MTSFSVSVVIPVKNRSDEICRAIDSCLRQTFLPKEIIVVDDGSTDDTVAKIKQHYGDNDLVKLHLFSESKGAPAARNFGIKMAKGTYIALLDSDDEWLEEKIALQRKILEEKKVDACFSLFVFEESNIISKCREVVTLNDIMYRNILGGSSSALIKTEVLRRIGAFNESLPSCQDWDLWIRVLESVESCVVIQKPLVRYFSDNSNRISSNLTKVETGHRHIFDMIRTNDFYGHPDRAFVQAMQKIRLAQIYAQKFGMKKRPMQLCVEAIRLCNVKYKVFEGIFRVFVYIIRQR